MTMIERSFDSPQALNSHVKKSTGSLIRLPGVTTVKWLHIGAALMFLSHTPSLVRVRGWSAPTPVSLQSGEQIVHSMGASSEQKSHGASPEIRYLDHT